MKKLVLSLGLTLAAFSFLPTTVSAHEKMDTENETNYSEQSDWKSDKCDRIASRLERIRSKFDQENDNRLNREQELIDRSNELGCPVAGTVVDTLIDNGNFTTLVAAVKAAGLVDALSAPGDKTIFAPTDQAFAALPAGTVESLLADIPSLTAVLTNHVVAGASVNAETAKTLTQATALGGGNLTITTKGCDLYINDSKVIIADIMTSNGLIHAIDAVLVP